MTEINLHDTTCLCRLNTNSKQNCMGCITAFKWSVFKGSTFVYWNLWLGPFAFNETNLGWNQQRIPDSGVWKVLYVCIKNQCPCIWVAQNRTRLWRNLLKWETFQFSCQWLDYYPNSYRTFTFSQTINKCCTHLAVHLSLVSCMFVAKQLKEKLIKLIR